MIVQAVSARTCNVRELNSLYRDTHFPVFEENRACTCHDASAISRKGRKSYPPVYQARVIMQANGDCLNRKATCKAMRCRPLNI